MGVRRVLVDLRAVLRDGRELVGTPPSPGQCTEHRDAGKAAADALAAWSVALDDWASEATAGVLHGLLELLPEGERDPTAVIEAVLDAPSGGTITLDGSASTAPAGTMISGWAWDQIGRAHV